MEDNNISINSILQELNEKRRVSLGHFGALKINSSGGVWLENSSMITKPPILDEAGITAIIQKYINYLNTPRPISKNGGGKSKTASFAKLKGMVK